ncbi:MAG: hypothetical protein ACRD4T_01030, partial [Candidatus Acidiferrales bacterium]
GLTGQETFDIGGLGDKVSPRQEVAVAATAPDGAKKTFKVVVRLDSAVDVIYYRNGGILQAVLRSLLRNG